MRKLLQKNNDGSSTVSLKDDSGMYVKASEVPAPPPPAPPPEEPMPDADAASLLHKSMEILRREVRSLTILSKEGKLGEKAARDLSSYIRLLHELAKDERDILSDMTDEELAKELDRRGNSA